MIESFITAFIIYYVVINPLGNTPIFLTVTGVQDRIRKMSTPLEGTMVATTNMLFFVLWSAWILAYLNISEAAFKDCRRHYLVSGGGGYAGSQTPDPQTCCKQRQCPAGQQYRCRE